MTPGFSTEHIIWTYSKSYMERINWTKAWTWNTFACAY